MKKLALSILAILLVVSCSTSPSLPVEGVQRIEFQLGSRDFPNGDNIIIEEVLSSSGEFEEGALVIVRGSYDLRGRDIAKLYLGTTRTIDIGPIVPSPRQSQIVSRGTGRFELVNTIPGPGYPHVTFYDKASGSPFGGVYFGHGDTLLVEKSWSYAR